MNLIPNFYPMRPTATGKLPSVALIGSLRDKFIVTPKLNGDRAIMWVLSDGIYIHNRHGSTYKFTVSNRDSFAALPVGTVMDGEVYGGEFLPFEVLALGEVSYTTAPASMRHDLAAQVCKQVGCLWLFAEVTDAWLRTGKANGSQWEGVVIKLMDSQYLPLKTSTQESPDWFKLKW